MRRVHASLAGVTLLAVSTAGCTTGTSTAPTTAAHTSAQTPAAIASTLSPGGTFDALPGSTIQLTFAALLGDRHAVHYEGGIWHEGVTTTTGYKVTSLGADGAQGTVYDGVHTADTADFVVLPAGLYEKASREHWIAVGLSPARATQLAGVWVHLPEKYRPYFGFTDYRNVLALFDNLPYLVGPEQVVAGNHVHLLVGGPARTVIFLSTTAPYLPVEINASKRLPEHMAVDFTDWSPTTGIAAPDNAVDLVDDIHLPPLITQAAGT